MPEREQAGREEKRDVFKPIVDMLAFFAAMRNYSYLDALGNALERATVLEALGNALRDFRTTCLDASPEARRRLESEEGVRCPSLAPGELEEAVKVFSAALAKREESGDLVPFLREIYVKALAAASRFRVSGG